MKPTLLILLLTLSGTLLLAQNSENVIFNNALVLKGLSTDPSASVVKYFSFDANDVIKYDFKMSVKAGTNKIEVYSYPDNELVYSRDDIKSHIDSFIVGKKGVYYFSLSTIHLFDRGISMKISRVPSTLSKKDFSTNVVVKADTIFNQASSNNYTVSSKRFSAPINLPPSTRFWVYWVGIGDEPIIKYETYTEFYREGKKGNNSNPLYSFGVNRLSELPANNYKHSMDYSFANNTEAQKFRNGQAYNYYTFKIGNGLSADYGKVETSPGQFHLLVSVPQQSVGSKLKLIIGAFIVNETYVMETP